MYDATKPPCNTYSAQDTRFNRAAAGKGPTSQFVNMPPLLSGVSGFAICSEACAAAHLVCRCSKERCEGSRRRTGHPGSVGVQSVQPVALQGQSWGRPPWEDHFICLSLPLTSEWLQLVTASRLLPQTCSLWPQLLHETSMLVLR